MKAAIVIVAVGLILGTVFLMNSKREAPSASASPLETFSPKSGGELVRLPGGQFSMGCATGRADETPHAVTVGAFFIDRQLVTQEFYERVMGLNPSKRKGKTNPVEQVKWKDAAEFCNKCSELDGFAPCYDLKTSACKFDADGYRLPTEAEWEYACRAGSTGLYSFGNDEAKLGANGWSQVNSGGTTHPVGQKAPNAFGLFDMQGNVWQWCNDFYSETYYKESAKENPRGPANGTQCVLRGGAWDSPSERCRAAYRFKEIPAFADACFGADSYGFRRVKSAGSNLTAAPVAPTQPAASAQPEATKPSAAPPTHPAPVQPAGKFDAASLKGQIVFVSDRSGILKIWTMRANGADQKQLTRDENPDADPRFSPDGKTILYTTLRGGFPEVWMMNRDGSSPHFITKGSQGSWSPDGARLVFIRDNQTFVRELASGKELRVTPENWERCGVPAWSPDGTHIAVASRHLENVGIFIVSADGKENAPLKTGDPSCTPSWSRDGKKMLCQTVQGHIYQLEADGKNWEQITFGLDMQHDGRYSPDGSMVIYAHAPAATGPWQICVQKIDDEESSAQLTKEGSNLQPDWIAE